MHIAEIKLLIEQGLASSVAEVGGDGTHFEAIVVSPEFAGKPALARHRMVYQTLGNRVGREIHALSIQAYTPEEWESRQALGIIK